MKDNKKEFDESIVKDDSAVTIEIKDGNLPEEKAAGEAADADSQEDAENMAEAGAGDSDEASEEPDETAGEPADDYETEDQEDPGQSSDTKKDKKKKKSQRALEMELDKAKEKALEMTDRFQRLMAEFENARKRMDKEKGQMFDIGAKSVLEKLLPVVDNFERGLDALSEEEKQEPFAQGIEKIYQQMMTVFDDLGVKPMDAAGKEFNPDLHNAVMHVEDEELGENIVAEEFQKGYMYKDSVLRHSMVKVAN